MRHLIAACVLAATVASVSVADERTYLYPVKIDDKWGYVDAEGKVLIAASFDYASPFQEDLALVVRNKSFSFIDTAGVVQFASPCTADLQPFSGGFARGSIGLGFHYFDRKGKLLSQRFAATGEFSEGLAAVCVDPERFNPQRKERIVETGKWGFIDRSGELVIPATFAGVGRFSEGLAPVYLGGCSRMCTGLEGGKWGYIDHQGMVAIEGQFDSAQSFSEGLACVGLVRDVGDHVERLHGYVTAKGEFAIEPRKYYCANSFHDGLAAVRGTNPELPLFKQDFGFIDKQGSVAIPSRFSSVEDFSEGLAAAQEQPAWNANERKWIQGNYGYVNKQGKWAIRPQFYWANEFVGGLARVGSPAEGYGYIDRGGRRVAWWEN